LSALERAEQIDEWRVLTEVRQVSAKLEETSSKGGRPGAVAETARDLGVSESEARRSVKIASISDDAKDAAKAAGLDDNQSVLLKVAAAPVETQADVVAEIAEARANKAAGKSATVDEVVEAGDDHLTPGLTAVETATFRSLLHKIVVREFTFDYDDDSCAFREPRPDPDGSRARFIESLDTAELEHRVMYGNYDLMQRMFGDFKKTKVEKEFARAAKRAARRAT
jgi:ParB family chromosome partitioning protein